MNVLFLNPPFLEKFSRSQRSPAVTKSGTLYYPIWLSSAAGVLIRESFNVQLIDAVAQRINIKYLMKIVNEFNPELLVVDTSTPSIYNDIEIVAMCKKYAPSCFVTLVGPHVSGAAEETLKLNIEIDALARGEYDYTIRDLAQAIKHKERLDDVLGLSFRRGTEIIHNPQRPKIKNLDELPFVSSVYKQFLDVRQYFFAASSYPEIQIFTARGCPFNCFFCVYPQVMHGNIYRTRSPENVVEEFKFIADNFSCVKEVVIEDDTFTVDQQRVEAICDRLIKEKNRLLWNANVRVDLSLSLMRKMKAAGCRLVIAGFESGDQEILNNMQKGITIEQSELFFQNARKAGLLVHAAFMAGNPGETKKTLKKTFCLAKKGFPDTVQFFPLMVYPGTKAFQWAKNNNFLKTLDYRQWITKQGMHNCLIDLAEISAQDMVSWCNASRRKYYFNLKYLVCKILQLLVHPREIKRTIKAGVRFSKHLFKF